METITAYVYACIDYSNNSVRYGVNTTYIEDEKKPAFFFFPGKIATEGGIWDGVPGSGNGFAEETFPSLQQLAEVIQNGVEEYPELKSFLFCFDLPDLLWVDFFKDPASNSRPVSDMLSRERPLNEHERDAFGRAFAALQSTE